MNETLIENILDSVEQSKLFEICGYKNLWISGSSTEVYPISFYESRLQIDIQLSVSDKRKVNPYGKRLINDLTEKFTDYSFDGHICIYDGSCPNEYRIYIKNK